jgi:hypothetical protein
MPLNGNDFEPFRFVLFKTTACYFHVNALHLLVLCETRAKLFSTTEAFASIVSLLHTVRQFRRLRCAAASPIDLSQC